MITNRTNSETMYDSNHSIRGHNEHNREQQQEQQCSELNDTVEKILLNVESRQSIFFSNHKGSHSDNVRVDKSKLSIQELEQLSLLSSTAVSNAATVANSTTSTTTDGIHGASLPLPSTWATVNLDSLCDLCKLLEEHIRNASRVDFIKFAREAFDDNWNDNSSNSGCGRASSNGSNKEYLDQVRSKCAF